MGQCSAELDRLMHRLVGYGERYSSPLRVPAEPGRQTHYAAIVSPKSAHLLKIYPRAQNVQHIVRSRSLKITVYQRRLTSLISVICHHNVNVNVSVNLEFI